MREVDATAFDGPLEATSFSACVATILELPPDRVPVAPDGDDPGTGWTLMRWLGGLGMGLVRVADAQSFSWAGPWIARVRPADGGGARGVVMYGVPSGVAWDPSGVSERDGWQLTDGFVISALDVALARPARGEAPTAAGVVEAICVAPAAGATAELPPAALALPGLGLEGDRHVRGLGTFPSGLPGSALTLIEAEVCESFDPPLGPDEHRRNLVTRGIDLNRLVGREFSVGEVPCRGMRLCEPCTVVDRYAHRPVLRPLVHRGGLRADILAEGNISIGDPVTPE